MHLQVANHIFMQVLSRMEQCMKKGQSYSKDAKQATSRSFLNERRCIVVVNFIWRSGNKASDFAIAPRDVRK